MLDDATGKMTWVVNQCLSTVLGCLCASSSRASISGSEKSEETPPATATAARSPGGMYTMRLQLQADITMIGVATSGQIYKLDDDVVLKSGRIFEPPPRSASSQDHWFYASETIFHANLMKNEQFVMRLLQQHPHPNIVEVIDADHPEGVYLRRYVSMADLDRLVTPVTRIQWYSDIARALEHLHGLGIAHSDLRRENVVFDDIRGDHARLCDFSAAAPFGGANIVLPDQRVPAHGLEPELSDSTDRFALATLIFQLEHRARPGFGVGPDGALVLPDVSTKHAGLDRVIRKAWLGQYSDTGQMRSEIEESRRVEVNNVRRVVGKARRLSRVELQERVWEWREKREKQLGRFASMSCSYYTVLIRH